MTKYIITASLLLLLLATPANADGWKLDLKARDYNNTLRDVMGRLTKDFGKVDLSALMRTFDDGTNEGNHLNVSLSGEWFGAEYLTGQHIRPELQSISVLWPSKKKPTVYATPAKSVLHLWAQKEFDGGFFSGHFYDKDGKPELEVHVRAEF